MEMREKRKENRRWCQAEKETFPFFQKVEEIEFSLPPPDEMTFWLFDDDVIAWRRMWWWFFYFSGHTNSSFLSLHLSFVSPKIHFSSQRERESESSSYRIILSFWMFSSKGERKTEVQARKHTHKQQWTNRRRERLENCETKNGADGDNKSSPNNRGKERKTRCVMQHTNFFSSFLSLSHFQWKRKSQLKCDDDGAMVIITSLEAKRKIRNHQHVQSLCWLAGFMEWRDLTNWQSGEESIDERRKKRYNNKRVKSLFHFFDYSPCQGRHFVSIGFVKEEERLRPYYLMISNWALYYWRTQRKWRRDNPKPSKWERK